jgi:hypothetical protein
MPGLRFSNMVGRKGCEGRKGARVREFKCTLDDAPSLVRYFGEGRHTGKVVMEVGGAL